MKELGWSGGCFTRGPLLFSPDDQCLFVCHGQSVLVLDGRALSLVRRLAEGPAAPLGGMACRGQRADITALAVHPTSAGQLFTGSADGTLCLWQYETGELLQSWHVGQPIVSLLSAKEQPPARECIYVVSRQRDGKRGAAHSKPSVQTTIWRLDMARTTHPEPFARLFETGRDAKTALSADGRRLAYSAQGTIVVWDADADGQGGRIEKTVTCPTTPAKNLALHPALPVVHWSDSQGQIFAHDYSADAARPVTTTMHWHARSPKTLAATPDGRHLLSGGEEGVVVAWDLERNYKQFLPHLESSVVQATSNHAGDYYAALTEANSVLLVAPAGMQVVGRYEGLKAMPGSSVGKAGLVSDPRSPSAVLLNSVPGQLQSFDPIRSCSVLSDLDVCQQNIIGRGREAGAVVFSDVYRVAFSADSRWMATYDRRMTAIRRLQHDALRFWRARDGKYQLYTAFDVPHGEPISRLLFSPRRTNGTHQCVTVGGDAKVKVWNSSGRRVVNMSREGKAVEQVAWVQAGSLTYKSLECRAAAFSPDGSILAVGFGPCVRLYDAATLRLAGSLLISGSDGSVIQEMLIVGDHLVASDARTLAVWDLGSMRMAWSVNMPATILKMHPDGATFAAHTSGSGAAPLVMILSPCSPVPTHCYRHGAPIADIEFVRGNAKDGEALMVLLARAEHTLHVVGLGEDAALPAAAETSSHQIRRPLLAADLAASLEQRRPVRPAVLKPAAPSRATRRALVLPKISLDKLLLSTVPSHLLPSTPEAFEHYISCKLPAAALAT